MSCRVKSVPLGRFVRFQVVKVSYVSVCLCNTYVRAHIDMHICVCVCIFVWGCVRERRDREREQDGEKRIFDVYFLFV